ncbi:hypothetical protein G9A89_007788 [Geosiphon pyriformis]|nr:hypothetical protein G9A89_007788 [Geosiphon pyriformis]
MFISGLESGYLGANIVVIINFSLTKHVCKVLEVPGWLLSIKLLFKNKLSVLILGLYVGTSLANSSHKCASFKKCLDLELINFLVSSPISASILIQITDPFLCLWNGFKDAILANAAMFLDEFAIFTRFSDLNMFKKKWFKNFDDVFTKKSLRFHKLVLLVFRIVKASHEESVNVVNSDIGSNHIYSALLSAKKSYCAAKLAESLRAKEANIRSNINKKIESFEVNKDYMIRSVLEYLFHKVVLNHLIVNDELILQSDLVKFKIDVIMES